MTKTSALASAPLWMLEGREVQPVDGPFYCRNGFRLGFFRGGWAVGLTQVSVRSQAAQMLGQGFEAVQVVDRKEIVHIGQRGLHTLG